MVYPTCPTEEITQTNNGVVRCGLDWVLENVPVGADGTTAGTIDFMSSGQFFGSAFAAAAVIVLSAKLVARLLNMFRR